MPELEAVFLFTLMFLSLGASILLDERIRAYWKRLKNRRNLRIWQDAAASCGLQVVKAGPPLRALAGPLEEAGQLSLSADAGGQLSLRDDEEGAKVPAEGE